MAITSAYDTVVHGKHKIKSRSIEMTCIINDTIRIYNQILGAWCLLHKIDFLTYLLEVDSWVCLPIKSKLSDNEELDWLWTMK